MKISNIILLATSGILFLGLTGLTLRARHNLKKDSTEIVSQTYQKKGFESIEVNGDIQLTIEQGNDYSVSFKSTEKNFADYLNVEVQGNTLAVSWKEGKTPSKNVTGEIVLPHLFSLNLKGEAHTTLTGLQADEMKIELKDESYINFKENQIKNLNLTCENSSKMDFRSGNTASFQLESMGKTRLYFSGGKIEELQANMKDSSYAYVKISTGKTKVELSDEARFNKN